MLHMQELKEFLLLLGLREEEAQIYLFVLQNGTASIVEISRHTGVNRMSLYRYCEELSDRGFLRRLAVLKTTKYEASSLSFLKTRLDSFETRFEEMKEKYQDAKHSFEELSKYSQSKTKVIQYIGHEKVKQLIWNSLDATDEVLSFGYRTLKEATSPSFVDNWWGEMIRRGIVNRILMNEETLQMKNSTENEMKHSPIKIKKVWKPRVIPEKILKITQETFLYNDVHAIVQWEGDQVFGVEIYNKEIVEQEKGIFNILWDMGKSEELKIEG